VTYTYEVANEGGVTPPMKVHHRETNGVRCNGFRDDLLATAAWPAVTCGSCRRLHLLAVGKRIHALQVEVAQGFLPLGWPGQTLEEAVRLDLWRAEHAVRQLKDLWAA